VADAFALFLGVWAVLFSACVRGLFFSGLIAGVFYILLIGV
jgi:hypothetical protein